MAESVRTVAECKAEWIGSGNSGGVVSLSSARKVSLTGSNDVGGVFHADLDLTKLRRCRGGTLRIVSEVILSSQLFADLVEGIRPHRVKAPGREPAAGFLGQ